MLIKELDIAVVDPLCDFLADLMGRASLDHVQSRPSVLGLRAGRRADEQRVFLLAFEVVLLDVVRKGSGDFPRWQSARAVALTWNSEQTLTWDTQRQ